MDEILSLPSTLSSPPAGADASRELQRRVNELRQIDNVTNWKYIAREYLLLVLIPAMGVA
jgi:hypothetical protein